MSFRWPWQTRYDKDAVETSSASVQALLRQAGIKGEITTRDNLYLRLDEDRLKAMVYDAYPSPPAPYREDFFDCDDYSDVVKGAVLLQAIKDGLRYAPVFGLITYKTKRTGGWHRAAWAITSKGRILLFEPQSEGHGWRDLKDDADEIRSMEL